MITVKQHYEDNRKDLINLAKRRVVDNCPFVAEECVQSAYEELIAALKSGRVDSDNWEGVLYKILYQKIYDANETELKRGMSGKINREIDYRVDLKLGAVDEPITNDLISTIILRVAKEQWGGIKSALHRQVMRMFFVFGYSHKEIAQLTGIKAKTSRNIVNKCMRYI